MANLYNRDHNGYIPSTIEATSAERLTTIFRNRYGTFSDAEQENITIFARNADEFMRHNMIPSWEMGTIVIDNLRGEPSIRARRWRMT